MWTTSSGLLSALLYLAATVTLGVRLVSDRVALRMPRALSAGLVLLAACLHSVVLYHGVVTDEGLNLGFFNALSLVTWVVVVFLLLAALSNPVENLGLVALPAAAVAIILALSYPSAHFRPEEAGFGLTAHIVLAIVAYSLFAIAAVQALLLAFQDRQLRRKHFGGIMRALPPLQTMENLLFQVIGLGFFLLSLAIVSGMMFLQDMFAQHVVHKTVLSIAAWIIFAVLLWGRWRFGWRGRVAIRWSLGGFVALMLAYFGSKLVLELILQR